VQERLCEEMKQGDGLEVPVGDGHIRLNFVAQELPTTEETNRHEPLYMLGVHKQDKCLVAFEVERPGCGCAGLKNPSLQGFAHREWLQFNKVGIGFVLD
jgi:hypothetical protein